MRATVITENTVSAVNTLLNKGLRPYQISVSMQLPLSAVERAIRGEVSRKCTCETCGREYLASKQKQRFCCYECRKADENKRRQVHRKCQKCGKDITNTHQLKYCADCAKHPVQRRVRECPICGKELTFSQVGYCSNECRQTATAPVLTYEESGMTVEEKPSNAHDISMLARAARERGMSYGEYIRYLKK